MNDKTKHFVFAIPIALVFGIFCVLGVASALEFKDEQWGGTWDWNDWMATMCGGIVGQVLQITIISIIL